MGARIPSGRSGSGYVWALGTLRRVPAGEAVVHIHDRLAIGVPAQPGDEHGASVWPRGGMEYEVVVLTADDRAGPARIGIGATERVTVQELAGMFDKWPGQLGSRRIVDKIVAAVECVPGIEEHVLGAVFDQR